jgi:hypothetical protein
MLYPLSILSLLLLALIHLTHGHSQKHSHPVQSSKQTLSQDTIPYETRVYWIRKANAALAELASPCPYAAFGSVVVNHTDTSSDPKGKLVCMSVNQNMQRGNPTLHGDFSTTGNWVTANESWKLKEKYLRSTTVRKFLRTQMETTNYQGRKH